MMLRWTYQSVIVPKITYGSFIWGQICDHLSQKTALAVQRLQRLALLSLGHFRKSTPTAGLEVVCDIKPLELEIKKTAIMTFCRLSERLKNNWDGIVFQPNRTK
jgi:hypothetical protein